MGLLRNKLFGFGSSQRGSSIGRAEASNRVEFAPIERRVRTQIPEKRSSEGDFKTNFYDLIGNYTGSGTPVNEQTALGVAAVTACVGLLADMVAKLPIYLYRDTPKGPKAITNHPAIRLIGSYPSEMHTSFELRQLMETGKGLGGNGYGRVYRNSNYEPRSIQWLAPCEVQPQVIKRPNGECWVNYKVEGVRENLTRADIIHVRGFSRDGVCGISPVRLLRESIGTSLSQTNAAGKLMRNGTTFPGILSSKTILPEPVIQKAREEWNASTTGGNLGKTPVLNGAFDFQQTNGMNMVDAQFIESRRFELQEVARMYRVPAFLIGDPSATTWGSGIEQMTLGFLNFCLDPHLIGWEQSLGFTLLTTQEQAAGLYFRFDRDQLANVALEARAAFYQTMRNIGAYSPNDVLRKENEKLIAAKDGGDDYGKPFNASGGTPQEAGKKPEPEPAPTL